MFMSFFFTNIAYASESLDQFINNVDTIVVNPLIVLLFALALVYFLWGIFQFVANQDNEEKRSTGKRHMIWGLIGITIMMGVWMILTIIMNTFGITGIDVQKGTVNLPNYTPPPTSNTFLN